jgi:hypothetical protein
MHPACLKPEELLADCEIRRQRRSGPGGQHRNKVETGIAIIHLPTKIKAEATERRKQEENRRAAVFRLRVNLALHFRANVETAESPTPLWQSRRQSNRIRVSATHHDFPALLAEALDVLADVDKDVRRAAESLGVSSSQFTKLLKIEPRALKLVNQLRLESELPSLK